MPGERKRRIENSFDVEVGVGRVCALKVVGSCWYCVEGELLGSMGSPSGNKAFDFQDSYC